MHSPDIVHNQKSPSCNKIATRLTDRNAFIHNFMQVVSTACNKSANIKLQQVCKYQAATSLQISSCNKSANISRNQWPHQPDNLVPLCKFQIIIIIHFFRNWWFSQSVNWKYLHSGTKSSGLQHADISLQQVCKYQVATSLQISSCSKSANIEL